MAARQFIYHMQGLGKTWPGGKKVLENINLSFYPDAKIGVLGVNGSGKSTLLRIMAGLDAEFVGEGFVAEGATVGYLPQEPALDPALTVRGNAMLGVKEKQAILDRYNELAMNYSDETADEMTRLQDEIEAKGLWDLDSQVEQAMDALGCPPDDSDVATLSGGERRRVALCRLLLEKPDLLLLDEPTNHLDAETVNWLEGHLRQYPGAILIVTHDRYFLDNVTGWILELDRGRGIPYEGNYSSWLKQKQKRLEQEGREEAARQRALAEESEWIASSPKARQAKSKARIAAYDELVRKSNEKAPTTAQIIIPVAERLGQNVIDFADLTKGYGEKLLIDKLTFKLPPGGIVGVIGAERRRQDDALSHDHRPGEAGLGDDQDRRIRRARLCRPVARRARRQEDRVGGDLRRLRPHHARQARDEQQSLCRRLQFQGPRPAEEGRPALRRRAQPRAPRQNAEERREPHAARRADQRPRRRHVCARWKRRCSTSPAAPSSSATTAFSSTASPPTCWPSKATATSNGSKAISPTTRKTRNAASGSTASSRTGSSTRSSRGEGQGPPAAVIAEARSAVAIQGPPPPPYDLPGLLPPLASLGVLAMTVRPYPARGAASERRSDR